MDPASLEFWEWFYVTGNEGKSLSAEEMQRAIEERWHPDLVLIQDAEVPGTGPPRNPCAARPRTRHGGGCGGNATRGEAMSEQDVETLRGSYDAFNSGNPQGVLDRLDAEVEWIEPFEHAYVMKDGKVGRMENKVDQDAWTAAWS